MIFPLKLSDFIFWSHWFLPFRLEDEEVFEWAISDNRITAACQFERPAQEDHFDYSARPTAEKYSKVLIVLKDKLCWRYSLHKNNFLSSPINF